MSSRRHFLRQSTTLAALLLWQARLTFSATDDGTALNDRIAGMLLGSFIGDALGGPVEFQERAKVSALPDPPKTWRDEEVLDEASRAATARRLRLRPYSPLRPTPEPYAHWTANAAPGTITDDSRHKLVLLEALRRTESTDTWPFDVRTLAQAYIDWSGSDAVRSQAGYAQLCDEWLEQWLYATRWVLGQRNTDKSLPPERLWNGLPTCCGQMVLLPLAAIFAGRPVEAYRAAHHLAYFDNGWGRDLNAALVAALATALVTPTEKSAAAETWQPILTTLRQADPYRYGQIPWVQRSVDRWLDVADRLVRESDRRPARLFAALEREFANTIKWEAQVPFVVTFAVLALADYDPLAALQLSIEWGHDTDSYAQLLGAFVGAVHGVTLFDSETRGTVAQRLRLDYGADVHGYVTLLERLHSRARGEDLFSYD
ncbi:MAG: ADP-ribosylglycohydrolase family protein [Phycisphaerales bacterium]|nr:MAG: ADP-ribosylglycohydrolase family protein [Phycisphaerales bacterium]